ncbi:methyltransferase family protein [Gracilaria domingensis]|nr:methyltransferase family protein [Gracilaria domingensis]
MARVYELRIHFGFLQIKSPLAFCGSQSVLKFKQRWLSDFSSNVDSRCPQVAYHLNAQVRVHLSPTLRYPGFVGDMQSCFLQLFFAVGDGVSEYHTARVLQTSCEQTMAHPEDRKRFSTKPYEFIISSIPKEDKIANYDSWAPVYEQDLETDNVCWWNIATTKLFNVIKANHHRLNEPVVVDAGCGTGTAGVLIRKLTDDFALPIKLIGYDYSQGMLDEARKKNVYHELFLGDFFGEVPIEDESADYLICAGVFLDGHVGPEAMLKILSHLKRGGFGVITIRITSYEAKKAEYESLIKEGGCVIIDLAIDNYLGEVKAAYVTVQKV